MHPFSTLALGGARRATRRAHKLLLETALPTLPYISSFILVHATLLCKHFSNAQGS
jgi:hypothetical protein